MPKWDIKVWLVLAGICGAAYVAIDDLNEVQVAITQIREQLDGILINRFTREHGELMCERINVLEGRVGILEVTVKGMP